MADLEVDDPEVRAVVCCGALWLLCVAACCSALQASRHRSV